jgi:hypothetical protein
VIKHIALDKFAFSHFIYLCTSLSNKVKKRVILISAILILLIAFAPAQKLQYGVKGTLAGTVILPSAGGFDKSMFKTVPGLTIGLGFTGNFYLDKKFRFLITSGIQLQVKTYSFRLYNLDVSNVKGMVSFRPLFISPEVPLILGFEKERKRKDDAYVNFQIGAVFAYNMPFNITGRQKGPFLIDPVDDTLVTSFDVTSNNLKTFSPDIYLGISWVKKKKKRRISEWGISFQYALMNSATYNFTGSVMTLAERKDYAASFTNKLSYIAVHYIFYPKKWISL